MGGDVSKDLVHGELMDLPLNHHVLHAPVIAALLHLEPRARSLESPWSDVTSNGDNPVPYPLGKVAELKLTTINNVVYAFGKKNTKLIFFSTLTL